MKKVNQYYSGNELLNSVNKIEANKMTLQKWEYKETDPDETKTLIEYMNEEGQEGWECCDFWVSKSDDLIAIVWKRPIE